MKIGMIGQGAIGRYVCDRLLERGYELRVILVRSERLQERTATNDDTLLVDAVEQLPGDIDHMVDCAGHSALREYGPDILRRGIDLTTVSSGALADPAVYERLEQAATEGDAKLHLASGAIGALDCLRAAKIGTLKEVTYIGRKPPQGWKGSPAESKLDLDSLDEGAEVHFDGTARDAALQYPKNANVAAAVALAGMGFDETRVMLIADPDISENIHEIQAEGDFGRFAFEIRGRALPDNPRSSALAAMSVISRLEQESLRICP